MTEQTRTDYERHAAVAEPEVHAKSIVPWLLVLLAVLLLGWYLLSRRAQDVLAPEPVAPVTTPAVTEPAPAAETRRSVRPTSDARTGRPRATPAMHSSTTPERIVGQSPEPEYPADSLRRGEGGSVLLRVNVGADGRPGDVDFVRRSGSRELDRAAQDAVSAWRFTPARSDGKPVAAVVEVPIEFKPQQ